MYGIGHDQAVVSDQGTRDHIRASDALPYSPLRFDTAQVFGRSHHWIVERKKRLGGDEFRKQKQPNGPRSDILGEGILRQHSRP